MVANSNINQYDRRYNSYGNRRNAFKTYRQHVQRLMFARSFQSKIEVEMLRHLPNHSEEEEEEDSRREGMKEGADTAGEDDDEKKKRRKRKGNRRKNKNNKG